MSEAVKQIYDNWGNRASLKEPEITGSGERVFRVGGYSITIPDEVDQPAKVASVYNRWGASENPMPNLSFSDGEMRIPVEDFVDLILRRVPADELAEGLWADASVRERFVHCMAHRYSGDLEDADRRKLLNEIQVVIHAVAIDRAIERLNHLESNARSYSNQFRWRASELGHYTGLYRRYQETLYEMRSAGLLTDEQVSQRLKSLTTPDGLKEYHEGIADPINRESVGPEWRASRDYWRGRLEEVFPEPASAIEAREGGNGEAGAVEDESAVPAKRGDAL
jgi:hypothetical protein